MGGGVVGTQAARMFPVLPLVAIPRTQFQIPIAYYKAMLKDHIETQEKQKQCRAASDEEKEEEEESSTV